MKSSLLPLMATAILSFHAATLAQTGDPITNPIPEPIVTNGVGIQLEPWVQLGSGPGAPRINGLVSPHDGSGRLFAVDQFGPLHVIQEDGTASLYLELQEALPDFEYVGGQAGFSYLAFHPEFEENGIFFTVTSAPTGSGTPDFEAKRPIINSANQTVEPSHHDVIHRWQAENPAANAYSGPDPVEILRFEQPYADHNVGMIAFRHDVSADHPDYGLLYMAVANGGSDGWPPRDSDPQDHGQDFTTPYGAHLRIDPLGSNAANGKYGIPVDNPWVGSDTGHLPELWTYGHRNPHRFSWDPLTGNMYSFEIGQWFLEEINLIEPGLNYGWGERYGNWVMDQMDQYTLYPLPDDDAGYTYPLAQYAHPGMTGNSGTGPGAITDGHVYRGTSMPEMWGRMIFADFANASRFFYLDAEHLGDPQYEGIPPIHELELYDGSGQRRSISQIVNNGQGGQRTDVRISVDTEGELYVTNKRNGWVYKVASAPDAPTYELAPNSLEVAAEGGQYGVGIDLSEPTARWTAVSESEWIDVAEPRSGTGSGTVEVVVSANPGSSERIGIVRVNGLPLEIAQASGEGRPIDAYFPGAAADGTDRWASSWYGTFRAADADLPWIWHAQHGWQWLFAVEAGGSFWIYDIELGWHFLARQSYPWIYYLSSAEWCYFSGYGVGDDRWFWNAERGWFLASELAGGG